jgi:hypothetical protein
LMKAHVEHVSHCRFLKAQGLHTFVEMVWCYLKNVRKKHFKVVDIHIFNLQKNVHTNKYTKFGVVFSKNCMALSNVNIIEKAFAWCKYWMNFYLFYFIFHMCY